MKVKKLCFKLCQRKDKIRFVFIIVMFSVFFEEILAQIPDLTLLTNKEYNGVTQCIAGGNTMGLAFSLAENFNENDKKNVPSVKENHVTLLDETGRPLTLLRNCSRNIDNICNNSLESYKENFGPILDERWNYFSSYFTKNPGNEIYPVILSIEKNYFQFSFSLRTPRDAHIVLYGDFITRNKLYTNTWKGYYIIFDGSLNSVLQTVIRKCAQGIPNTFPTSQDSECKEIRKSYPKRLLSGRKWAHFTLEILSKKRFVLWESGLEYPVIDYLDTDPIPITSVSFKSYHQIAEWKLHNYTFESLQNKNEWTTLVKNIKHPSSICVSLYVAMCEFCEMQIVLQNNVDPNQKDSQLVKSTTSPSGLISWEKIKLSLPSKESDDYSLSVFTILSVNHYQSYWYVDQIRECSLKEIRIINTEFISEEDVTCQLLKKSEWKLKTRNVGNYSEYPSCLLDPPMIGKDCSIPCYLLPSKTCDSQKICIFDQNLNTICTFANGFQDYYSRCSDNKFGYGCKEHCGSCQDSNFCNGRNGFCLDQQCSSQIYAMPYCKTTKEPILLEKPTVVNTSHNMIALKFNNTSIKGIEKAEYFQIQYKFSKDYLYMDYKEKRRVDDVNIFSIDNLKYNLDYEIRVLLFTDNITSRTRSPGLSVIVTTCQSEDNLTVIPQTRSVEIVFSANMYMCSINDYQIKIRDVRYLNPFTPIKIKNLDPFTNYTIELYFREFATALQTVAFTTLEEAPGQIRNLRQHNTTDTQLFLIWDAPYPVTGKIRFYEIYYQHTTYKTNNLCKSDMPTQNKAVKPEEVSNGVILSDLKPYSRYKINVIANTISPGPAADYFAETLEMAEPSDEELPSDLTITEIKATTAQINWKFPDCFKIRGELFYKIAVNCVQDEWCNLVKQKLLFQNAFNMIINIWEFAPFTNYKIEFRATRYYNSNSSSSSSVTKEFKTKADAPPAVRNLTIYSVTSNSILFRWLAPYPPNGEIDNYTITYNPTYKYILKDWKPCELWEDNFICSEISIKAKIPNRKVFQITVTAKNIDIYKPGTTASISRNLIDSKPTPPLHFHHTWNKDEKLVLMWNLPDLPNGKLTQFEIEMIQNDTAITNLQKKIQFKEPYFVSEFQNSYTYTVNQSFTRSSSYVVNIRAVNKGDISDATTILVVTSPETPELRGPITAETDFVKNTSIIVKIPAAKINTKSEISYIYLIVRKIVLNQVEIIKTGEDIFGNHSSDIEWIALEKQTDNKDLFVVIGDGQNNHSIILKTLLENRPLEPDTKYQITAVVLNEYRGAYSFNKEAYTITEIRTASNSDFYEKGIYALLLLLLLPILGFLVYKKFIKKESIVSPRKPLMSRFSTGRQENNSELDILHLTEANPVPSKTPVSTNSTTNSSRSVVKKHITTPNNVKLVPSRPKNVISKTKSALNYSKWVALNDYEDYLKLALELKELDKQHAMFPRGPTKPWTYGILKPNKLKNRYNNLVAYDDDRVKLTKINNDPHSDYINASYINGYNQKNAYIATQGPKPTTLNDFWRMIWQENVQYIIMLANLIEGEKKKCEQYWPDIDTHGEYGPIQVYFETSDIYADFEFRILNVSLRGEHRKVTQLHFTSWPDHGVPLYPQSLVLFLEKIQTIPVGDSPIVVHCSAGVGRTGTIILCDICLRMAAREGGIDILKYLVEIRNQRANMVDNSDQYKLVHMVLLECLLSPKTTIPCDSEMALVVEQLIAQKITQQQITYIEASAWQENALNFIAPIVINPINNSKNRFQEIVPDRGQVLISRYPFEDIESDYINAVPIDGFRFKEQFIVTQIPLPNTVKDFWRMINEKSVKVIMNLNNIPENDPSCCIYWPTENIPEMDPVPTIHLYLQKVVNHEDFDNYFITIEDKTGENPKQTIQLLQYKKWDYQDDIPDNLQSLVSLWDVSENLPKENFPTVVTCFDGAKASGIFVAMSFVIEKMKLEHECDVCLAVRVVRRNRKQFIINQAQFDCLYNTAVLYLNMFETYSNFEINRPYVELQ